MKIVFASALVAVSFATQAQTLRIGLAEDPDVLDPSMARTFVGRIVFAGLCDKLFDLDEKLNVVPQLATSYEWSKDNKSLIVKLRNGVTFHDGEKFDAQAVKYNLERHKDMKGSNRRGELAVVSSVDAVDASTVRINLAAPFAPLLAVLTDRAGMMVSPKAAEAAGDKFGARPVCSGPFKFVERIAQDRIVLERFPNYWNKGQIHFDRIVYQPIVDATVRLANLRSGQLDFIERMAPSDVPQLRNDSRFKIAKIVEIGYQGITINVGKSDIAQKNPLGKDARVREAFELSLDRDAIVKVAMEGEAQPGNQWVAPSNQYYGKSAPIPKRNVERAKPAAQGGRRAEPELHADDADHLRCATHRADRAGDGQGCRLRHQDPVHRVRHLAQPRGQGPVRGLRARVERPRRSGRQPAHHARLQRSDELRRLLQGRCRGADQRVSHLARSRRAAPRRTTRSPRPWRRTGRSSTCTTATGCGRTTPSSAACVPCRTAWCACRA